MEYKDKIILSDIAKCSVSQKADFVDLLNESGVPASDAQTSEQLIDVFLENISTNKELLIGAAYMCAFNTSSVSFDGEKSVDNAKVHDVGRSLFDYFEMGSSIEGEDHSQALGALAAGLVGKLASKFGKNKDQDGGGRGRGLKDLIENRQASKDRSKFGTIDYLEKQREAKALMLQQVMAQKAAQQQAELKKAEIAAKTRRTWIIAGSVGAGLLITTAIIFYVRSNK
tara:strand:- start:3563 stop:4243 length:681 start_codon:yes stop_codon:yes gene_type:complete